MKGGIKNIVQNNLILSIVTSIIIFLLLWIFWAILSSQNTSFQYWFSSLRNHIPVTREVSDNIIVVEIDNKTYNSLGFPMDRAQYAPVLNNLVDVWVSAIGIDIIFEDPSNSSSDNTFAQAIATSQKTLLGFSSIDNKPWVIYAPFKQGIVNTWFFDLELDRIWWVHEIITQKKLRDKKIYTYFPISVLQQSQPQLKVPTDKILINFLPRRSFNRVSFLDVADINQLKILSKKINFQNAIVLVWITADGTKDVFKTPNGQDYGVYVHANTINTILQWYYSQYFNPFIERILLLLCLILGCYLNFTRRWWSLILSNIAVVVIFLLILQMIILLGTNLIPNFYIEFLFGLVLTLILSNIVKYIFENKDKKKLHNALWEYVSKEVSAEILWWTWEVNFDGESKRIAMFFSDIEWFTSISEKFTPEKLVFFLREYLGLMSNIIMDQRWFINKYEWDAIMALWGAFGKNDNIVYNACLSALQQQKSLSKLNESWTKNGDFDVFKVRMGIHVWEAILGNIGATGRKLEFTALWDNVNLSSRLEWINKFYNTYICVSQDVYNEVWDDFEFRYLDNIKVKWKNKPIKIYELLSIKWKIDADRIEMIDKFNSAIELYYRQDFTQALDIFTQLESLWDGPSHTYMQRCSNFIQNPPGDDWDKIWIFSSK